jgi:hypothetical protein
VDLGLTRYFTGKECKHGHIAERKTASGQCAECSIALTKRWQDEGRQEDFVSKGKELPPLETLKEIFEYHPDGHLIWRIRPREHFATERGWKTFNSRSAGNKAGYYNIRNGYITINLNNVYYKGHRIIYKLVTGVEPLLPIDHIDGDVLNNKIENLREATQQENCFNSAKRSVRGKETSIYKGVQKDKKTWLASLKKGEDKYLKRFNTELEAAMWYDQMALELFGDFSKLNFPNEVVE